MLEIENFIPKEGWNVALLFDEGYWAFQIMRKQQTTRYAPYWFNSDAAISSGSTSGWTSPADSNGRNYLEPQEEETVYQIFTGFTPSSTKMYLQYTERVDRMNLITPRAVPGPIGYWDGELSMYRNPDPETELWTVHDIYPYMNLENPAITGVSQLCGVSFWITPFSYKVIKDRTKTLKILRKEIPGVVRTMGDARRPIKAPYWLINSYASYMVQPDEV